MANNYKRFSDLYSYHIGIESYIKQLLVDIPCCVVKEWDA